MGARIAIFWIFWNRDVCAKQVVGDGRRRDSLRPPSQAGNPNCIAEFSQNRKTGSAAALRFEARWHEPPRPLAGSAEFRVPGSSDGGHSLRRDVQGRNVL